MPRHQLLKCALLAAWVCLFGVIADAVRAQAQYPSELVKIVVPYPPGAGIDFLGRLLADRLSKRWNQNVIVENRGGAAGLTGSEQVANSAPNGHTLLIMPLDVAINPATFSRPASDPIKNLTPIAALSASTQVVAASTQSGIMSVADLVRRAKAEPGKISFGSCGNGSPGQVIGEQIKKQAGVDMTHVSYRGCAPAVNDAIGGHVNVVIGGAGTVAAPVLNNTLKGLAVASDERDPQMPDLPTLTEAGLNDVVLVNWFSLFGPPNMPAALVDRIHADLQEIYKDENYKNELVKRTMKVFFRDPVSFKSMMTKDVDNFGRILQALEKPSQ